MSICVRKPTIWVPTRSDTNRTVQSQKKVQVGNDQEKAQSKRDSHSKKRGGKNNQTNNKVLRP